MNDPILIAIIVGFFGTITALIGLVGVYISRETHRLINSRMDEMLTLTRKDALAEGAADEKAAQRKREVSA